MTHAARAHGRDGDRGGAVHVRADIFGGATVRRAPLPRHVRAAWVEAERVFLVRDDLDDAAACEAVVDVALEVRRVKADEVAQRRVVKVERETERMTRAQVLATLCGLLLGREAPGAPAAVPLPAPRRRAAG